MRKTGGMCMHRPGRKVSMLGLLRHKTRAWCVPGEAFDRCSASMVVLILQHRDLAVTVFWS